MNNMLKIKNEIKKLEEIITKGWSFKAVKLQITTIFKELKQLDRTTLKQDIREIINSNNNFLGRLFDLILLIFILLSILIVMLETVESIGLKYHTLFVTLETIITVFFTAEYILRVYSSKKPWKYIFSFYGIIDLIAILPMYLIYFFKGASIFAIFRGLRLLRLFKILNHPNFSQNSEQLRAALLASRGKILVFIYFVVISCILIGSLMYVIEGKESGFTSIPISIYWSVVTLTTVGYGDISPITPLGQSLAAFVMILGYGIIAVPTGIVTAEFSKSKNNAASTDSNSHQAFTCPACNSEIDNEKAIYCHNCGTKLKS